MSIRRAPLQGFLPILILIVAGEAIFALPFHIARFFRPALLDVTGLTATELGMAQGAYGVVAMLCYFPGGPLADRFQARGLMALSLLLTAGGGLYLATFPDYPGAVFIWAFFGVSTILCFWAALIRATRNLAAEHQQGAAYGLLEGGRGALAAVLVSLGVLLFALVFPDGYDAASPAERREALRWVILGYCAVTGLAGCLVWWLVPADKAPDGRGNPAPGRQLRRRLGAVLRLPAVWLQAIIVFCAYVGYKGFDNFALYAVEVRGIDAAEAAELVAIGAWVRPVAALGCGVFGDRFSPSRAIALLFALLLASDLYFALASPGALLGWVLTGNMLLTCLAIFGLRGLYFALFSEASVPKGVTGTAAGIVSVVGFLPEIFVMLVAGVLIDRFPGLLGHRLFFGFLGIFAALGLVAALRFARLIGGPSRRTRRQPTAMRAPGGRAGGA